MAEKKLDRKMIIIMREHSDAPPFTDKFEDRNNSGKDLEDIETTRPRTRISLWMQDKRHIKDHGRKISRTILTISAKDSKRQTAQNADERKGVNTTTNERQIVLPNCRSLVNILARRPVQRARRSGDSVTVLLPKADCVSNCSRKHPGPKCSTDTDEIQRQILPNLYVLIHDGTDETEREPFCDECKAGVFVGKSE